MELWTIQDERVMDDLETRGVYRVAPEHIYPNELASFLGAPDEHVRIAYDWMCAQMHKRIGPAPEGVSYPIWAWRKRQERSWEDKHPGKPDMRSWVTDEPQRVVRLMLEVPDSECLVSDFDAWHVPLNFAYFSKDEQDDAWWDGWLEEHGLGYASSCGPGNLEDESPQAREARRLICSSWERLFCPEVVESKYWTEDPSKRTLQATFWELRADYVRSSEHFTTRTDKKTREKFNAQARRNRERLAAREGQQGGR